MSIEKKNKGRDQAATIHDLPSSRLVRKFVEMLETDYIRSVVIPVLEAEGFNRIDFHHGSTEVGKDLIFWREEGFGRKSLVVAVVKTDRLSKSSSDISGLPVFLVQVEQALDNDVVCWDGQRRRPDKVLVVFADDPSHDIISSTPGGLRRARDRGAEFLLGSDIANSLIKHRIDIAEQILETKLDAVAYFSSQPTNLPLLHALQSNEMVKVESIFTELNASFGSMSLVQALTISPSSAPLKIDVKDEAWPSVSSAIIKLESILGPILSESLSETEDRYRPIAEAARSTNNQDILRELQNLVLQIHDWAALVQSECNVRVTALTDESQRDEDVGHGNVSHQLHDLVVEMRMEAFSVLSSAFPLDEREPVLERIQSLYDTLRNFSQSVEVAFLSLQKMKPFSKSKKFEKGLGKSAIEIEKLLERELRNARDFLASQEKKTTRASKYIPAVSFTVEFDAWKFSTQLKRETGSVIHRFQSIASESSPDIARRLLGDTRKYLEAINSFVSTPELRSILEFSSTKQSSSNALGACILTLLNSGADILLLGNAGSGKSTTLEFFAKRRYQQKSANEEVIFVPLSRLLLADDGAHSSNPVADFAMEVARLFSVVQPGVTQKVVEERLHNAENVVLVLDGVDEASTYAPWILKFVCELKKLRSGRLQVVASSRFKVPELENTGFFSLQLLPFGREQVIQFIGKFLRTEPTLADQVIEHLYQHSAMFSVVQTPLMSTILCILAQNGVSLPETKNALYRERFELLWGAYDAKKQIRRVVSSRAALEDISKKIAYYLHYKKIRSASEEVLLGYVRETLSRKYKPNSIDKAFCELERPCNVLVRDFEEKLGFGHLTYQEYLASDELYTNRSSDIAAHLPDPWWRETLVLAAMKTDDIGTIIEQRISQAGAVGSSWETLEAMIEVCHGRQKRALMNLLVSQIKLDSIDRNWCAEEDIDSDLF